MQRRWDEVTTDDDAARIAAEIDRQGYGMLTDYVSPSELEPIQAVAHAAVKASGGEYTGYTGAQAFTGTMLGELPQFPAFQTLCARLYELGSGQAAPKVEFHQVFRCLQGSSGQGHSYKFHYDSYVLTALLPIVIPEDGMRGDLLVLPSTRPLRRWYVTNLLDKLLVDNKVTQFFLKTAARHKKLNTVSIKMEPGNIYFFWGYRSIHTNEPCDPDKLRATALLHYGDPHRDCRSRAWLRLARSPAAA